MQNKNEQLRAEVEQMALELERSHVDHEHNESLNGSTSAAMSSADISQLLEEGHESMC